MIIAIIIAALSIDAITFVLGFLIGFQHGEASIGTRLRYSLLREDNANLKLACRGLKDRLRIKNGDPYDYEDEDDTNVPPLPEYSQLDPALAKGACKHMDIYMESRRAQ